MEAAPFSNLVRADLGSGTSKLSTLSEVNQTAVFRTARYSSIIQAIFMEPLTMVGLMVLALLTSSPRNQSANGQRK